MKQFKLSFLEMGTIVGLVVILTFTFVKMVDIHKYNERIDDLELEVSSIQEHLISSEE